MKTDEKRLLKLEVSALVGASASYRARAEKCARKGYWRCAYEAMLDAKILDDKVAWLINQ
jgi:hypothetical protein